jgi:hypothetical protein
MPDEEVIIDSSSDIGAIGLTISGFILTLLTIIITFRSGQILSNENLSNNSSPFRIFLASPLYKTSINILKYGVISLVSISFSILILKILIVHDYAELLFYINIIGLIIILMTFIRCFYILNLIIKMQNK